ncbi:MAG: ImmA/IrrE family metallo-endopeptidase [Lachnospiraceae bacterium]|nr:ImmA/IrrE family metallo-endopeptidase [Ruminococcus sp.]MCM1276687.1 ImmA/IrrE family metallo-endopeptidase [Lachnospiraceae bacterium]
MKVNVSIAPTMINWIISQTQMSKLPQEVAENLNAWKNGEKTPTFKQVVSASKATGIPLGYFFLQKPPVEDVSLVEHRTVDSISVTNPSRDLLNTVHDMEMIQDWMREQLIADGFDPLDYVGKFKVHNKKIAENIRTILGIDVDWHKNVTGDSFGYIRNAISNSGAVVMMSGVVGNNTHRPLDVNEFRAFTLIDKYAPLIFINSNDSSGAKLFSLLHEFAHICFGERSLFNDRYGFGEKVSKLETVCNAVAAEIIVPQEHFIKEWNSINSAGAEKQTVTKIASKFKCGNMVVARKALDNDLITGELYKEISRLAVKNYNEQRKKKSSGGDFYNTLASRIDKRFLGMLTSSVAEGKTLYTDAYRFTNTNRETFDKLAKQGGIKNNE